jgi:Flp pilus assembly protein TadD
LIEILRLISSTHTRRPARACLFLDELFRRLARCEPTRASETEDRIWDVWMHHPHRGAQRALDLATGDIAARRYDIAETRLTRLLRRAPEFAEAWHKRAALYYVLGRDAECVHDLGRTLALEPRHFGALSGLGTIMRDIGDNRRAVTAYRQALEVDPHLDNVKQALDEIDKEGAGEDI